MVSAWSDSEASESESDEEHTADICLMAKEVQNNKDLEYENSDMVCLKLWYLDNGCSRPMSSNATLFTEIKKKEHENFTFGDKSMGKIIGIGKVSKDLSESIDNVYLVDGLKFNLLSIAQLCDKMNQVSFDSTHCVVQNKESRKVNLYGLRIENVYAIDLNDISSFNLACFEALQHDENS